MRTGRIERRLVWIMGSPRSGSTWLLNLMALHSSVVKIDEPLIGAHLGTRVDTTLVSTRHSFLSPSLTEDQAERRSYFFSQQFKKTWAPRLRELLIARFSAEAETVSSSGRHPYIVIKEPHGSEAAHFIFEIMGGSKLLFLVRDARDVIDSALDGAMAAQPERTTEAWRLEFVAEAARAWVVRITSVLRAYEQLPTTQRHQVRYEDLLTDPVPKLLSIYEWLELDTTPGDVQTAVDRLAFERVPAESRGSGHFHRAATPGLWRTNLTQDEQQAAWEIAGNLLRAFDYDV